MQLFVRRPRRCRRPRSSAPASRGREANEELKRRPEHLLFSGPLGGFARFGGPPGAPGAAPGGSAAGGPWDRRRLGLVSGAVAVRAVGGSGGWGTVCCGCGRRGDGDLGDLGDLGPRGPRGSRRRAGRAAALRAGGGAAGGRRRCGRVAARSVAARSWCPAVGGAVAVVVPPSAVLRAAAGRGDSWAGFAERERTAGATYAAVCAAARRLRSTP